VNTQLGAEGNVRTIQKLFGSDEYFAPETILECTGVETSVCTAVCAVRRGGTVMVIGIGGAIMNNLPFMHIFLAEVSQYLYLLRFSVCKEPHNLTRIAPLFRSNSSSSIAIGILGHLALRVCQMELWILKNWLHTPSRWNRQRKLWNWPRNGSIKVLVVDVVQATF
jgi:hypothetical protein